jgi:hypothetical protein
MPPSRGGSPDRAAGIESKEIAIKGPGKARSNPRYSGDCTLRIKSYTGTLIKALETSRLIAVHAT